jgi:hypothetical protein
MQYRRNQVFQEIQKNSLLCSFHFRRIWWQFNLPSQWNYVRNMEIQKIQKNVLFIHSISEGFGGILIFRRDDIILDVIWIRRFRRIFVYAIPFQKDLKSNSTNRIYEIWKKSVDSNQCLNMEMYITTNLMPFRTIEVKT